MKVSDIIQILENIAPKGYQESYDNSGLNIGNPEMGVKGILCTLDVTMEVLDEAQEKEANLIISHHPLIFKGLKSLTGKNDIEKIAIKAIQKNIAIYAGHTNFDNVPGGVNTRICQKLGLINCKILSPIKEQLLKLVTFAPVNQAEQILNALFKAGAGNIGNYDNCSYSANGTGSYRGLGNSKQYVGNKGEVHYEKETRIEVILPGFIKNKVLNSLLKAHPYEEVAYDIYHLKNDNPHAGAGMIGELEQAIPISLLLKTLETTFEAEGIRYTGDLNKSIKKIAVCGGSGSFLINDAKAKRVDAFITGDIKYHQFFDAGNSLSLIDIGHYESEQYTKDIFYESVMKKIPKFAVHLSKVKTNPVKYFK